MRAIQRGMVLLGSKAKGLQRGYAFISTEPLNAIGMDICGGDSNEAWIMEIEIEGDTVLELDPHGDEAAYYGGGVWYMAKEIKISKIVSVEHIEDVQGEF